MGISSYLSKFALGITPEGLLSPTYVGTGTTTGAGAGGNSPTITSIVYTGDDTATSTAGGSVTVNGTNFNTGVTALVGNVQATQVTRVSATQLTFVAPANSAGNYILYVVNTDGGAAISVPGLQYSGVPTWTTGSGSLGTSATSTSFTTTIAATGDAPISYSVVSGALPAGITLNTSTGVISGTTPTVSSSTLYNFTVRATDAQNQDTDRVFSLTVLPVTFSVTPAANNINENSGLTVNVTGDGIPNGTYYWTVNTNAGDFGTSSGSFTITSNSGSFTVVPTADAATEGSETFTVSIRSGSTSGSVLATTSSITINDTSTAPTITPASSNVNEGSALTFNAYHSGINYAVYYWVINHITTTDADFSANSGEVTINSASGSFTVTATADAATEGSQTFTVSLRDGPPGAGGWGNVIATSSTVTINDTSTTAVVPTVIGQAFGGGYYAGKISTSNNGVATHYLIVAPKSTEVFGKTFINGTGTNAASDIDGATNTANEASRGSNAAQYCQDLVTGGYSDWHLPAKNELETMYFFLKPTEGNGTNYQQGATHTNAVDPEPIGTYYTSTVPGQTTALAFRQGGGQHFEPSVGTGNYPYWCSTEHWSADSWRAQRFDAGHQEVIPRSYGAWTRAVRRIPV